LPSADEDLRFLKLAVNCLEDYLISEEIYWPLEGSRYPPGIPSNRLSLGILLLTQKRLHARHLNDDHSAEFRLCDQRIDEAHARWKTHWETKAAQEYPARMRLWGNYLEEYRQDPAANYYAYSREVDRRVMLELLGQTAPIPRQQQIRLQKLDYELHLSFIPGTFLWASDLSEGFPREQFWYLYGALTPNDGKRTTV
jgi:hypothetical protein